MNSHDSGRPPQQPGSGRAARLRRRRRKRIALFASFILIILLLSLAAVLLALKIADVISSGKNPGDPDGTGDSTPAEGVTARDYIPSPQTYLTTEGVLILVNNDHKYDFPANSSRLYNVYEARPKDSGGAAIYGCLSSSIKMDKSALAAFNAFMEAFYAEKHNPYASVEAYRSYDDQLDKQSATAAGHSDHHTGYLVTVRFVDDTKSTYTSENSTKYAADYDWLNKNAAKYGFVLRYPASKTLETGVSGYSYAYRYVGTAHAAYMSESGLCLEEYVELLKSSYKYSGEHLKINGADGKKYEVYYVAEGETLYVPAAGEYEVSGDNTGGLIVTLNVG